ncbi:MAG: hypothetical protein AAFQ41_07695, partial [Cyanobacteria bacterium J06623_7]
SYFAVNFVHLIKPILLQLRAVGAFSIVGLCAWSLISCAIDVVAQAKKMHQIPCTKCRFFTGDYRLKCTVNPAVANTEQAIGCSDYHQQMGLES